MAPSEADGHGWTAVHGKIQPLWFSGPLIPTCIGYHDRLPIDDDDDEEEEEEVEEEEEEDSDGEESDSEGDLAFDEYTVSESESDYEWMYSLLGQCIFIHVVLEVLSNFILTGSFY